MVERTFSSDTKEDRKEWIDFIESVKANIQDESTKSDEETPNKNPFTINQGFFRIFLNNQGHS